MTLDGCYVVVIISINLCGGALVWELASCAKDNGVPFQVGSNKNYNLLKHVIMYPSREKENVITLQQNI
jgi:hypothetical protein